jgi:NAD(P)-dependent dehydrogenase (short-subunit alcohol dehydrogenase family)
MVNNKSIIITGSNGLIGSYLSNKLSKHYNVLGVDKVDLDLTECKSVNYFMHNTKASVLINCFGLNHHIVRMEKGKKLNGKNYEAKVTSFAEYCHVNIVSLFSVCKHFIDTRDNGIIVNLSSIYGVVSPNPVLYPDGGHKSHGYSASKAAVIALTRQLAVENSHGFRINAIVLGGIENNQPVSFKKRYSDLCPMMRMMKLEEILPAINFLIDEKNTYMTGSIVTVDGGWTAI